MVGREDMGIPLHGSKPELERCSWLHSDVPRLGLSAGQLCGYNYWGVELRAEGRYTLRVRLEGSIWQPQ